MKRLKQLAVAMLAALTLFTATTATNAFAVTKSTAWNNSYNVMRSHCSDTWHSCGTAVSYLYCSGPYGGSVQWWCTGGQVRYYLGLFYENWGYKVGVGPYGGIYTWTRWKE